ncbi:MAG: GAF domain-containing sensor histidine kinase [Proteobacteria bacterium]|nr:GAF domain-containing sensor histidine kinase [Pseudomonadota bacterium]MBU1717372.1 GAF domain-containing sensor histidine kinase [Pseudomonadota bacterium]
MEKKLQEFFKRYHLFEGNRLSEDQQKDLISGLEIEYQAWFLSAIIEEIEEIMSIPPNHTMREILEVAAKIIVNSLGAAAATIRLFDPETMKMISFGACGVSENERMDSIPFADSIAGQVVRKNKALAIPNILGHPMFKDKAIAEARGFYSMMAVPLLTPMPQEKDNDLLGTLQIYFREQGRHFDRLEIIQAELLARRISFVLAKKKILDLQKFNRHKETIVNKIFEKLSHREAIKIKDLFILLIPELKEMLEVQGCSLFTLSDDRQVIRLEAAYPQDATYHDPYHNYTVDNHPYFMKAVQGALPVENDTERITSSYIHIKEPTRSEMITDRMRDFVKEQQIHSILLVPLKISDKVRHLLAFYATRNRQTFLEEEIELLIFFGKEIIKASKLEFLGDVLHDIKNPAVAVAGFAKRAEALLQEKDLNKVREKLGSYLEIISSESARMQDLAQALSGSGREEVLDLGEIVRQRYLIVGEVVRESKMDHVEMGELRIAEDLFVSCPRFGLERILDNMFGNAVRAVPTAGGVFEVECFKRRDMACLVVENSGEIPAAHIEQMKKGKVKGRGLNIISRFVHDNHGNMEIKSSAGKTRFMVTLPLVVPDQVK